MGRVAKTALLGALSVGVCAGVGCVKPPQAPLTQVVPLIGLPPIPIDETRPGLDVQTMASAEAVAASQHTVRIPASVASSLLKRRPVSIGYPDEARSRRLAGKVRFRVIVGKDGNVEGLTMVEASDPVFVPIATASVQSREYRPYQLNGQAVAVDTTVQVDFAAPQ
jgi:outer membrane biosynthesis protein TonB